MSHDDILDDMSLSDDELLDNLADDMLMEMAEEQAVDTEEDIPTIEPVRSSAFAPPRFIPQGSGQAPAMPDLGQMMSQMMPMMSQMFGGGANGNPLFGGNARPSSSIQQVTLPWEDVVKQHLPSSEADDWIKTIRGDERKQREMAASKQLRKPPSRSYRTNDAPLPNVYMATETLLATLIEDAVRTAHLDQSPKWREAREDLASQVASSGLASVFEKTLKARLRQRVTEDPDFIAERDNERYSNIAKALFA